MCVVNPLMPGHLSPFHDTQKPVVRSITFESLAGRRILPDALSGEVRVIADAYDRPAIRQPVRALELLFERMKSIRSTSALD